MTVMDQELTTLQAQVADLVVGGAYLKDAAALCGMTVAQLARQRADDPAFDETIRRARRMAAELRVDEMDDIAATEPDVNRARLRVDVIKWRASKEAAHVYGDRLELNVNQTVDIGAALAEARARTVRPARDLLPVIEGEVRVIASDASVRPIDKESMDAAGGEDAGTASEGSEPDRGAFG